MGQRLVIDPVTRIEGHARVTIQLDDRGEVVEARVHVTELRGFERFCVGRAFEEMPALTSRVCGICPVSHALASAAACDALLAVEVPPGAVRLRRLVALAQLVQSHALSFFHLSSPDWILGYDADPARRNLLGLAEAAPALARDGVALRRFGQEVIEAVTGRRIHAGWAVPGGVAAPLSAAARERILSGLPAALEAARRTLAWWKGEREPHLEEEASFGDFPSLFLALVGPDGAMEHVDGRLRLVDEAGAIVEDQVDPARYGELLGEAVDPASYMKLPSYRPRGPEAGLYRVGPLARLNVATRCGTPLADAELAEFRQLGRGAVCASFHAHRARLVEVLFALERMAQLLDDPSILSTEVRAAAACNRRRGVGAAEAPRGTLFHDYQVSREGLVEGVNLLVATGQNAPAMNRTVTQIARRFLSGRTLREGLLNRVEAGIRAYDPCLSCATHAAGRMGMTVELIGPAGERLGASRR
jgi:NAD-reducing hydrogenase large subunit